MKRLNPETGLPFIRGYVREDGRVFHCYTGRIKQNGLMGEHWTTPEVIKRHNAKNALRTTKWAAKNKERRSLYNKQWREANRQKKRENNRAWELANPEKARASKEKYAVANRAKKNAQAREYQKENPHMGLASVRKRQAAKQLRTPPWFNAEHLWMTQEAYALAKMREKVFGFKWHVDHIVPLRGANVSGLHVPWNLQVIPAKLNWQKGNRWQDDYETSATGGHGPRRHYLFC